jgi:hypothetical protein
MNNEPNQRSRWHRAARIVAVSLLIYVLSTGPAARLVQASGADEPFLLIYAPLELAANAFPPLGTAIRWYIIDVWRYTEPELPRPVPIRT